MRPKQAQRRRDQEDRQHLQEVGDGSGVLVGVRRVGVEEAAAVGAEHLDRQLRGDRAHRELLRRGRLVLHHRPALVVAFRVDQRLAVGAEHRGLPGHGLQGLDILVGLQVLDHAQAGQHQREDEGQRQQDPQRRAGEVDPDVADGLRQMAREAAHQRDDDDDAGGRGQEVLHRQRHHLRQVAQRRLAAVALPVGVGDEADSGVEGRVRRHRAHGLRVERQHRLQPLQRIDREQAQAVEHEQADGVAEPWLLTFGVDARQAEQGGLDPPAEGEAALHHRFRRPGQRPGQQQQDRQVGEQLHPGGRVHEKSSGRSSTATG
jgi:hypothetical protein